MLCAQCIDGVLCIEPIQHALRPIDGVLSFVCPIDFVLVIEPFQNAVSFRGSVVLCIEPFQHAVDVVLCIEPFQHAVCPIYRCCTSY